MNIGERIKKLRKTLNLTQQTFAESLKIKRNTIAIYETNRSEPSNAAISLICREFNVNEKWLRTGEGEMFAPKAEDNLKAYLTSKGVNKKVQAFIITYLSMPENMRKAIDDYIEKVYEEMQAETQEENKFARPNGLSDLEWEMILKMRFSEIENDIDLNRPEGLSDSEWAMIVRKRTAEVGQKKVAS